MSFYPPNNSLPITPFFFDKYYVDGNYDNTSIQGYANEDGVQVGRYIYVNSENTSSSYIHYSIFQKVIDLEESKYTYLLIAKLDAILEQGQVYWNDV